MWCWCLPEIVALSDEAGNLRCEVWVVLFSVTLWNVFLSASCIMVLKRVTVVSMLVMGSRFMSSNCVSVSCLNLSQCARL